MSKIDLQKYFDDTLTFTFGDQEFKVDESNKAYLKCKNELSEIVKDVNADDEMVSKVIFENAFGEKAQTLREMNLPSKAYSDIALEIMSAWTGLDKEVLKSQMQIKTPSK